MFWFVSFLVLRLFINTDNISLFFSCNSTNESNQQQADADIVEETNVIENEVKIKDTIDIEEQWMIERIAKIEEFANAVISDDTLTLLTYFEFPFERDSPIPAIQNEFEFKNYYSTLFDQVFKEKMQEHLDNPDIIDLSMSNGTIGILNGNVWFNDPSNTVISINYQSENEKAHKEMLEQKLNNNIHPILKEYTYNIFIGRTDDQLFRIDDTEKGLRYASWSSNQNMGDEPNFILWNGSTEKQGSAGGWTTTFDNVDTQYILDEVLMCEDLADCGTFLIIKDEGEITSKLTVTKVLNPFNEIDE